MSFNRQPSDHGLVDIDTILLERRKRIERWVQEWIDEQKRSWVSLGDEIVIGLPTTEDDE